jgi:hypothetical protein
MSAKTLQTVGRRTQLVAALAGLLALLGGLAILSGPGNSAGAAPGQAVYIGQASAKRVPLCPQRCSGLAIVSGFQAKAGGIGNAYRVPFVGKMTRWRIKLGQPNRMQTNFFTSRFGTKPQAAIGVLSQKKMNGKVVYKLRRRTQMQDLTKHLGKTATFNLPQPMNVNEGDYLALIVPTWAPALSVPRACQVVNGEMVNETVCDTFNENNNWIASRNRKTCNAKVINRNNSQAQVKVGSLVPYGCRFNGALTYGVRVERR